MTLCVFATFEEAKYGIELLNAKPVECNEFPSCYMFNDGIIVLSGYGIHAAQHTVNQHLANYERVFNFGFAGALKAHLQLGALEEICCIGKYVFHPPLDPASYSIMRKCLPTLDLHTTGLSLITSEFPVHHEEIKASLQTEWDLVDMEGYGILYSAKKLNKPCRVFKIVSDFASPGGRKYIQEHKEELSKKLASKLLSLL